MVIIFKYIKMNIIEMFTSIVKYITYRYILIDGDKRKILIDIYEY